MRRGFLRVDSPRTAFEINPNKIIEDRIGENIE